MPNPFRTYAARTFAMEKVFLPRLVKIIKQFRSGVIQDLSNGTSYALSNLQQATAPQDLTILVRLMYRKAGLMGVRSLLSDHAKYIAEAKRQKAAGFGKNEAWVQEVLAYLQQHLLGFVQGITDTMRSDTIKILQKGVDEGMSIDQIVKLLRDEGLIVSRAKVIARTEINRATNVGHSVGAQALPYEVNKKWSAADDHRTRHSHNQVDDHVVDELEAFKVPIYKGDKFTGSYDEMQYPGDATASASNTVNCRCRVVYTPKRDSRGRLVRRSSNGAVIVPMRTVPSYTADQIAAQLKSHIFIGVK